MKTIKLIFIWLTILCASFWISYSNTIYSLKYEMYRSNLVNLNTSIDFKVPNSYIKLNNKYNLIPSNLVVIDAGHGGVDPGANNNLIKEKDICLDIALKVNDILIKLGIKTYLTRSDDRSIDPAKRALIANGKKASLLLSIHNNSFENVEQRGTSVLYYGSRNLYLGKISEKEYAEIILAEVINTTNGIDKGIVQRDDLAILKNADMPSVIAEIGFISNSYDLALLCNKSFRIKVAEGLAKGVVSALIKADETTP